MNELILYALLELTYARKKNISSSDIEYEKKVRNILPNEWYLLSSEDRIKILNSAINNSIDIVETNEYKDLFKNVLKLN